MSKRKRPRGRPGGNPARVAVPPTRLQRLRRRMDRSPELLVVVGFDVLSVGFGLWCVFAGLHEQAEYNALDTRGLTATATVTDVTHEWGLSHSRKTKVYVDFETPTGPVHDAETSAFSWSDGPPDVGDQAVVRYDPKDPTGNVRDERVEPAREIPWLYGLGGPALSAVGIWSMHRPSSRPQ